MYERAYIVLVLFTVLAGCAVATEEPMGQPLSGDRPAGDEVSFNGGMMNGGEEPPLSGEMLGGLDIGGEIMTTGGGLMGGDDVGGSSMGGGLITSGGEEAGGELFAGETIGGESNAGTNAGGAPEAGTPVIADQDGDYVPDEDDNCVDVYNPEQSDIDQDGEGDACELDSDLDGIPNEWDPEPDDVNWPGKSLPDTVYAHTSSELFALDVKSFVLQSVGTFTFDVVGLNEVTDIAIDRAGVLWATTFQRLWICHPRTGECRDQGSLPAQYNGLTFLPGGLFMEQRDVLVGIELSGNWRRLSLNGGRVDSTLLGSYPNATSTGDAFSIENVGTFAAISRIGVSGTIIVRVDPTNPSMLEDLVTLTNYPTVYGLAGWQGALFAFDASGAVVQINPETGEYEEIINQGDSWWGAGVSSVLITSPDE